MDKIISSIPEVSATQALSSLPIVWGAISGQQAINQRIEELKEESKQQADQVFAPLYNRIIPLSNQEAIGSLPSENSRGRIPVARINLLPDEPIEDNFEDVDLESPVNQQEEEKEPLIQRPEVSMPPMGGPVPDQFQEFVQRNRQRLADIEQENQQQVDEIVQQVEPNAQGNRLDRAVDFARNINQFLQDRGIAYNQIVAGADAIKHVYNLWQESNMPDIPNPQADQVSNLQSSDQQVDVNKQRTDWLNENGVPPQCKRRVYIDQNGLVRSVVICESNNSQRIYHDK